MHPAIANRNTTTIASITIVPVFSPLDAFLGDGNVVSWAVTNVSISVGVFLGDGDVVSWTVTNVSISVNASLGDGDVVSWTVTNISMLAEAVVIGSAGGDCDVVGLAILNLVVFVGDGVTVSDTFGKGFTVTEVWMFMCGLLVSDCWFEVGLVPVNS